MKLATLALVTLFLGSTLATYYPPRPRCPKPPTVPHGYYGSVTTSSYGAYVHYKCKAPYSISYPEPKYKGKTICKRAGLFSYRWYNVPKCVAPRCKNPGSPKNGKINRNDEDFAIGQKVDWTCFGDFKVDGEAWAQCHLKNGRAVWTHGVPTCIAPRCKNPGSPKNGKINKGDEDFAIGAKVDWECRDKTFMLVGEGWAECILKNYRAVWSHPVPQCIAKKTCSNPGAPSNGGISTSADKIAVGEKVHWHCSDKNCFKLIGASSAECVEKHGKAVWTDKVPYCKPHPKNFLYVIKCKKIIYY